VELSWSTFLLEVLNFLVLVWILKAFLYRPVQAVLAQRRAAVEKTLHDAAAAREQAAALQQQYEGRLAEWERERAKAREALDREIAEMRTRLVKELHEALAQEREKSRVLDERRARDATRQSEEAALGLAARFAARLLARVAGPEVERRLIDVFLEDLAALPAERVREVRAALAGDAAEPTVITAHPMPAEQRARLEAALATLTGAAPTVRYREDPALVAGVRVVAGAWALHADVQDELKAFADATHAR
jgi:F-type H+-transporting ATPase subunit b